MFGEKVLHCLQLLVGPLNFNCVISITSQIFHFPPLLLSLSLTPYRVEDLEEQQINYFSWFTAEKDWDDIKFGVDNKIDFYAVSFVKDAEVVHELKKYLQSKFQYLSYSFFRK